MKETHKKYSTNFDYKSKNNYVTSLNPVQRAVGLIWKCLNKQATVDDDPTGIRWINNDLIGLK